MPEDFECSTAQCVEMQLASFFVFRGAVLYEVAIELRVSTNSQTY